MAVSSSLLLNHKTACNVTSLRPDLRFSPRARSARHAVQKCCCSAAAEVGSRPQTSRAVYKNPAGLQRDLVADAKRLAAAGRPQDALRKLQRGLEKWPTNGFLAMHAANIEAKRGHIDSARKLYAIAAARDCGSLGLQAWAGLEIKQRNFPKAFALFTQALPMEQASGHTRRQASLLKAWADAKMLNNDPEGAAALYDESLALQPNDVLTIRAVADLKKRAGNLHEAREWYSKAIAVDPTCAIAYQNVALLDARQGKFRQAQKHFQQGLDNCGPYPPIFNAWATMESKRSNNIWARTLYLQALDADPRHIQSLLGLGLLEARHFDAEKGLEYMQEGLRLQPNNKQIQHCIAQWQRKHGKRENAKAALEGVIENDPGSARAWHTLGQMAEETGNLKEAVHCYLSGIRSADQEALLCYEGLANVEAFWSHDDPDNTRARAVFEEGHSRFGGNSRFFRAWALFEKKLGNLQRASELFANAAKINPTDARTWLNWGLLERRQDNLEQARRCFAKSVELYPRNPYVYSTWANMEAFHGNAGRAQEIFVRGSGFCSKTPALLMDWAIFETKQGHIQKARELFQRGYDTGRDHPPLLIAWAHFEREQGRIEEADRLQALADACDVKVSQHHNF